MGAETHTGKTVAVPPKAGKKDPKSDPNFLPQLMWATGLLSGILLLAAVVIAMIQRWRKRQEQAAAPDHDQLASFRVLYERGELSKEEYERIRTRIVGRMKREAAPPLPSPQPPTPETGSANPPPSPGDAGMTGD